MRRSSGSSFSGHGGGPGKGLARYGSAAVQPVPSFLAAASGHTRRAGFFPFESNEAAANTTIGLRPPSCSSSSSSSSSIVRQRSSPPEVFGNRLAADGNGGFSITRGGTESCSNRPGPVSRTTDDQMNFRHNNNNNYQHFVDPILFPVAPQQPGSSEPPSQFQFSITHGTAVATLGSSSNGMMLNIPPDSVPCRMRAKRGCATHPRSIAERERRTRINGKLKKLQDLVPNMDKQTSYADMLDLAVQHIKSLETQVQNLNDDLEGCSCGSNRNRNLHQMLPRYKPN